jgi:hypothetical protein
MSYIDELLKLADQTAGQIRDQNICGWGNVIDALSDAIRQLQADLATSRAANASEFKRGQEVMREYAAKLIEDTQEIVSSVCNERLLEDRINGNVQATAYAPAIRNLPIG